MQKENYSTFALIRNLLTFVKPYRGKFFLASILRVLGEVVGLYPVYAVAGITTFFTAHILGESLLPFWYIMGIFTLTSLIYFVAMYYANFLGYPIAEKTAIDTKLKAIKHIFSIDIDWHEKENTGNKVKRIERGSDAVNKLLRMWLASFIDIGVNFFAVIFIIAHFDQLIAFFTLLFLIIYLSISVFYTRSATKVKRAENLKSEEMSGLIFESVNNIRSVKVMSMMHPLMSRLANLGNELYELIRRRIFWFQFGGGIKNLVSQIFRIAMIAYIGWGIMQGQYELGFLILFYGYFSSIQGAISKLADASQEFAIAKQDIAGMMNVLEVKPVTDVEKGKIPMPQDWQTIHLKDVSFAYGDKKVLDGVSFTISRGEKIGIMGLSGAGKSTLFKLLLKERENYGGEILIDDLPLRSISKSDYFTHAAVVLQDTEVFNFSLRNNVTISNFKKSTDEKLFEKALSVAHVSEFARALPQGADTLIGEKGVKLSGGEKQRVGLARAIFKDPELLLLDEATSHLDVESEAKIQDSLHKFFQSVTAIVIAHRLTTIKEMDKILVMEGGKIIEQGNFSELYKKKGRFYELWEKQKLLD
ncbi:MAG TPA: ABC transporter ATP-binding protein [Candidatus Paceibacterota bacterium]